MHLQAVAIARRRSYGPGVAVATQCTAPTESGQAPDVMTSRCILDDVAEPGIQTAYDLADHGLLALMVGSMARMVAHLYASAPYKSGSTRMLAVL